MAHAGNMGRIRVKTKEHNMKGNMGARKLNMRGHYLLLFLCLRIFSYFPKNKVIEQDIYGTSRM
jgi:hypothetical protein